MLPSTKLFHRPEVVLQRWSVKKVFLRILQNSQENTWARAYFLIMLQALRPAPLLKKRLWPRNFPVNLAKFLRTSFSIEHLWWLLLRDVLRILSNINDRKQKREAAVLYKKVFLKFCLKVFMFRKIPRKHWSSQLY